MPRESARLSRRRRRERRGQSSPVAEGQMPAQAASPSQRPAAVQARPRPKPLPPRSARRRPFRLTPRLYRRMWYVMSVVVILGMVGGLIAVRSSPNPQSSPTQSAPGRAVAIISSPSISDPNAEGLQYNSSPPTSGPHTDEPAEWGAHSEPIPKPVQVENLRRGGVLVQYNPDAATPEMVTQLEQIVGRYITLVALAPYPDMASAIALTAWGRIDDMDQVDEGRIDSFIRAYLGQGQGS